MSKNSDEIYTYKINAVDRITEVSQNWNQFALENSAPHSTLYPELIDKPIWDFICDKETIHLYEIILDKVRKSSEAITVPIRCDAPDLKRFIEITVKPLQDNNIEFESHIVRIEKRDADPLLDADSDRSNETLKMCSWCKKVELSKSKWVETEEVIVSLNLFQSNSLPKITHGICPECKQSVLAKLF